MDIMTLPRTQRVACRFCSLLAGAQDTFDSTWLSECNYKAMVSVGALVPGWSLVCPVNHVLNLSSEYTQPEFWRFANAAAEVVADRYGACAFFEHGARSETSLTGCGVGHAHGHLVPLNFSLELAAREAAPQFGWQECAAVEVGALAKGKEYLFVATEFKGTLTTGSICVLTEPTSQFFRRVIARKLGIEDLFDYKTYPMLDIALTSANELRELSGSVLARS